MNQKISISIITFNEEKIIAKCLEKLSWANEIVVIDSGSTDKTVEICQKFGAKVIYNRFENFGIQKQFALTQTCNDWVLSLDADEVLSEGLILEINNTIFSNEFDGYLIPRTHVFLDRVFKYGSENKKPILRLFNKQKGKFQENKVHETIEVEGKLDNLKNEMLHYTVSDIATAVRKNINYALLSGEFKNENNKKASKFSVVFKLPYEFFRVYFLQRNFLNGYQGFVWSIFSSFGSFVKYAKLHELNQEN
jgi:glycosyltransferase involved in cell wall biosynthesis